MNTFERDQKAVWLNVFQMELDEAHPQSIKIGLEYRASFEELYESARKILAAFKELPPDAPVPEEVISYWTALLGERYAEKRGTGLHRRTDALRFEAHKMFKIPFTEAMELTENELVWLFSDIVTMGPEVRERQAELNQQR